LPLSRDKKGTSYFKTNIVYLPAFPRLPRISEDSLKLLRKIRRCFDHTPTEVSTAKESKVSVARSNREYFYSPLNGLLAFAGVSRQGYLMLVLIVMIMITS